MTTNKYYVYHLIDPRTMLPFYVGKGCGDRSHSHFKETVDTTINMRKFNKIKSIQNLGLDVVVVHVCENLEHDDAINIERLEIEKYGRLDYDDGGISTNICQDANPPLATGRVVSDETRKKISEAQLAEKNHMWGKKQSDESNELRRQYNKEHNIVPPNLTGTKRSDDTKEKMRAKKLRVKKSPEHCAAIGRSKAGENHPNWGKALNEETRRKIGEANKGKKKRARTEEEKAIQSERMRLLWEKRKAEVTVK
jgi:hypothetical protein